MGCVRFSLRFLGHLDECQGLVGIVDRRRSELQKRSSRESVCGKAKGSLEL